MREFERMKKIIENKETLQRCLDNPYYINTEYEKLNSPQPSINGNFEKALRNDNLWSKLGIDKFLDNISWEIEKAVEVWVKLMNKLFWTDFWNQNDYIQQRRSEQDNNYYGSLNLETKKQLLWTIKQAIDWNWSVEELQEAIINIDKIIFWKGRAKTIAITEIHRAYEWWKYTPMKELQDWGAVVQKFRLTCNDDKVRETHMEAQDEGRVDLDYIFPSLWVKYPPWWYNCRCNLLYNVL